jgi:hypothetical protein
MTYITEVTQHREKKDEDVGQAEEGEDVIFDQSPVRVVCPHCGLSIITFIEHESSWVTYAACLILVFVLGWAAVCVVPIVFPLLKDVVHHCPRCLSVLATRSRVVLPSLKQEVMSFRFGSCVVVLARKYVLLLAVLTTVIATIHYARSSVAPLTGIDAVTRTAIEPLGWQDFTRDCGFKTYLGNPIHVTVAFGRSYKNRTFHWQGEVMHVEDGFKLFMFSQRGALFVRMTPTQFPSKPSLADLALVYEEGTEVGTQVGKLKRGANVSFDATMVEVGKRGAPHVMILWNVTANGVSNINV